MYTDAYLWSISKQECNYIRIRTNHLFNNKNFFNWRIWRDIFTQKRDQKIVSQTDNKFIVECTVFGNSRCLIRTSKLKVEGIPSEDAWCRLSSCKFMSDNGVVLAETQSIKKTEQTIMNRLQSLDLFSLFMLDGTQYIVRENSCRSKFGFLNPHRWITIVDRTGMNIMSALYYSFGFGFIDDLIYAPCDINNMELLLGILAYYACEAQFYRQDEN